MNNAARFQKLIADHYNGDPWIDVSLEATLEDLHPAEALKNINGLNSIWQIVYHMICWRQTLIKRMKDKKAPAPENNFFISPVAPAEEAWPDALKQLKASQKALIKLLEDHKQISWDIKPAGGAYSYFELVNAVLQHDAYHLGQIVIIKKMLRRTA
ncbi:MAG: DinB family protein [Ferruginibacter sp.]